MASTAPLPSPANRATLELQRLSVEQLKAAKDQTDLQINLLQDSLNNIRTATSRLESATSALDDLSLRPPDHRILVPLASSLYVPASLSVSDRVLVDVGTGYFIEKTMSEGKDYCERKVNLLKSNFDQLIEVASKKQSLSDEAGAILQAKVKAVVTRVVKLSRHRTCYQDLQTELLASGQDAPDDGKTSLDTALFVGRVPFFV